MAVRRRRMRVARGALVQSCGCALAWRQALPRERTTGTSAKAGPASWRARDPSLRPIARFSRADSAVCQLCRFCKPSSGLRRAPTALHRCSRAHAPRLQDALARAIWSRSRCSCGSSAWAGGTGGPAWIGPERRSSIALIRASTRSAHLAASASSLQVSIALTARDGAMYKDGPAACWSVYNGDGEAVATTAQGLAHALPSRVVARATASSKRPLLEAVVPPVLEAAVALRLLELLGLLLLRHSAQHAVRASGPAAHSGAA